MSYMMKTSSVMTKMMIILMRSMVTSKTRFLGETLAMMAMKIQLSFRTNKKNRSAMTL